MNWTFLLTHFINSCSNTNTPVQDETCAEAMVHLEDCTGLSLETPECSGDALDESTLILSLECEELNQSLGSLPLCETLGSNCNNIPTCGDRALTAEEYIDILEYSDSSSIQSIEDLETRITDIRDIFVDAKDHRGLFAVFYAPITQRGVAAVQSGQFAHSFWSQELMIDFAARYLDNLREHLLDGNVSNAWERYYDLTADCSASPTRVAAVGVNTHLLVDLPKSLASISSDASQQQDYENFGLVLVDAAPVLTQDLDNAYGTNSGPFFNGYFLGDWVDAAWGQSTMTTFAFQTIRNKAWTNGQWLQDWRFGLAHSEITASWNTADGILAVLDATGAL
ncbi:MAG: hypothetical protein CL916_15450 [Deltaproteobacteria bacterium]|nr:hypothetical protein [Deltaproteobacteria bacterium]